MKSIVISANGDYINSTKLVLTKGEEMKTQNEQIIEHLMTSSITPWEALHKYGIYRLAARISDMRAMGHNIETRYIKGYGKKKITVYSLKK